VLARDKALYDERVRKANTRLIEKEKEAREKVAKELAKDLADETEKVREEFCVKVKSREERFTSKQKELKKQLQDAHSSLNKVTQAKDQAANEVARLQEELSSLHGQIGPITKIIEASQRAATEAQTLKHERCKMFRMLAMRASAAVTCLGVRDFPTPSYLPSDDPAAFLQLFTEIIEKLETVAMSLDNVIEEECHELLGFVGMCVFSNLLRVDPAIDFIMVLQPVECSAALKLAEGAKEAVEALVKLYQREKGDGPSETSSDESSEDSDGSASSM
jgi:hypothetical protein